MTKKKELAGLITGLVAVLATACFFIISFLTGDWEYTWLVFLVIPVVAIVLDIALKNQDISGSVIGLIAILATGAFFVLGFVFGAWHPGWLVFIAIPIAAIVFDVAKKKTASDSAVGIAALIATAAFILMGTYLHNWHIAWIAYLLVPIVAIVSNIIKVAGKADALPTEEQADNKQEE